ncbi:MAG: phosphatidylserine decarboxylase family protein [Acidobacteria bacterium]|nr:phosphatidylserine decarboxylase family protein [Acidobacteriota bacterium]
MRIVSDAYRFAVPDLMLGMLCAYRGWYWTAGVAALLLAFILAFFRDPERTIPNDPGLIVSPADGKVVRIETGVGEFPTRISIFLSVFDVHVNRAPMAGRVQGVEYRKGKFKAAFDHSASVENERVVVDLQGNRHSVRVAMIAGLIARRIVSWIRPGDQLQRGQRIGLIRFGSRVDLYLPAPVQLQVKKGDRVAGGASIIGRFVDVR